MVNKLIMSVYGFKHVDIIVLAHMVACLALLHIFKRMRWIEVGDFNSETARASIWMAVASVVNIIVGMEALGRVNMAMFTTMRKLTAIVIVIMEYYILNVKATRGTLAAISLMIGGSIIVSFGDISFDIVSYTFVLLNNVATATYLVSMKSAGNLSKQLGTWGVFYYNSLLAVPMLIIVCSVRGSFHAAAAFPLLHEPGFIMSFTLSTVLSFALNYSTFWCTRLNSALTTSITGQTKNIMTTLLGILVFGGVRPTVTMIVGLMMSVGGSIMYAVVKYNDANSKRRPRCLNSELLPLNNPSPKSKRSPRRLDTEILPLNHSTYDRAM